MIDVYFAVVQLVEAGVEVEAGRSRFRFPMVSLEFFIDKILPTALWPWG
jgi:cell shape-determining protein MreD